MTDIPSIELQSIADVVELKNQMRDLAIREAALRRENLYLRRLFDSLPLGYQSLDEDGCFIEVNQSWLSCLGYTKQEVIGKYCGDFLSLESRERFKENFAKFKATGEIEGVEFTLVRKDGSMVAAAFNGTIGTDSKGQFQQTYCVFQDITSQKQTEALVLATEQRHRKILMAAMDGFWIFDRQGRILEVNQTYCQMSGYTEQELLTKNVADLEAKKTPEEILAYVDEILQQGEVCFETQHKKKDGSRIDVEMRVQYSPLQDELFVAFLRDVTDRKIAEQQRESLQKQLQQAQRLEAIGVLAGGIAHDFNNILGVMIGFTDMVLDDIPQDSQIRTDLEKVLRAGYRGKDLVGQILSFSRPCQEERINLQMRSIIKEVLKMLRASLPSTIKIKQKIDANCGLVEADPSQIHQIFMNLCTNAYHAMEDSGGVLTVEMRPALNLPASLQRKAQATESRFVELIVSDTGVGIPADIIEQIFDPFFTTKEKGKGTGMGLSIAFGIVQKYDGMITLESTVGRGTTFHVFLPESHRQEIDLPLVEEGSSFGSGHILFVDDEHLLVEMAKQIFERLGYTVCALTDSRKALEVFSASPDDFDLVITDQTMPDITGLDLARAMLRIRPTLPIILCTGYSTHVNEEVARKHGIRSFLYKPIIKDKLARLIKEIL